MGKALGTRTADQHVPLRASAASDQYAAAVDRSGMRPKREKARAAELHIRRVFLGSVFVLIVALLGQVLTEPAWAGDRRSGARAPGRADRGPFSLKDHKGRQVTDLDFRGKFMLVFFGYTHCPDVCPTDLQAMSEALNRLARLARRVQPIFITIDPERDTAEVLAKYVSNFHPRLIGLTGTPGQLASAAAVYRVRYRKYFPPDENAPYLLDHSASIYLVGPTGRPLSRYPHGMTPKAIATDMRRFLK